MLTDPLPHLLFTFYPLRHLVRIINSLGILKTIVRARS